MKKIVTGIYFLFSLTASAQDIPIDTATGPIITKAGKPDGEKTEIKITKDGGNLTSSDGNIELIIPAGAVSKKTTISIQPVINLMPSGNGKAYHLEPSGIQFQKPLQLILHYDAEEIEDSMQLMMGIAMQADNGQWYGLKKFSVDTVSKTISGNIDHFSTWASYQSLKLIAQKRIKVHRSFTPHIFGINLSTENKTYTDEINDISNSLTPLISNWISPKEVIWRVNNIIKGNAEFGTLDIGKVIESKAQWNVYEAPRTVPNWNPVTLSVDLVGASFKINGITIKNLKLKAKILIYDDDYEVKMVAVIRVRDEGQWVGAITATDEGSFIISLKDGKPYIKNIINKLEKYKDGCTNTVLNPTTCTGLLHVTGIKSFTITPANPPSRPDPIVEIWFTPYPMEFTVVKFNCPPPPGSVKGNVKGTHGMPAYGAAFPQSIKFIAKDGEQIIIDSSKDPNAEAEGYLKVWVQKIKDD